MFLKKLQRADMPSHKKDIQLTNAIDITDELIFKFFDRTKVIPSDNRYKLHSMLLNCSPYMKPLGLTPETVQKDIDHFFEASKSKLIHEYANNISNILWSNFKPTYTVANYWSPIHNDIRRSIAFKRTECAEKASDTIMYACIFYALTYKGRDFNLRSLVQYINDVNSHKRGLFTCIPSDHCEFSTDKTEVFCNNCNIPKESRDRWICFPRSIQENLIDQLGVEKLIEEMKLHAIENEIFEKMLSNLLEGGGIDEFDSCGTIASFAENILASWSARYASLSSDLKNFFEVTTNHLQQFFSEEQKTYIGQINAEQACFILATHLLWHRACCHSETNFMYIFPTHVSEVTDSCCVLTMGTQTKMSSIQELAATRLARSFFIHPLLLDFKQAAQINTEIRQLQSHTRLIGHNFPKILDVPAINQLMRIQNALKKLQLTQLPNNMLSEIEDRITVLLSIFEHNESLLTAVLGSISPHNFFSQAPKIFAVGHIFAQLQGIQNLYKEKASKVWETPIEDLFNFEIKANWDSVVNLKMLGHLCYLREALINITINSFEQIENRNLIANSDSPIINISANLSKDSNGNSCLLVVVEDKAGGFKEDKIIKAKAKRDLLYNIKNELQFNSTLCNLVFEKITGDNDEMQGLGLLFCAAYLRALEWVKDIGRPGFIDFINTTEGCRIVLTIPFIDGEYH